MFLCYTSQGVVTTVKWSISLVVTSNHKCLNKIVSNKLALIIFEPRTQPQSWYIYELLDSSGIFSEIKLEALAEFMDHPIEHVIHEVNMLAFSEIEKSNKSWL